MAVMFHNEYSNCSAYAAACSSARICSDVRVRIILDRG